MTTITEDSDEINLRRKLRLSSLNAKFQQKGKIKEFVSDA